ncbi:hypothetical protein HOY80DRAFT_1008449 [Tuber brumale]|nr:hypothetical protein HOY80DRAFT_1008449 [Tuber brumale]
MSQNLLTLPSIALPGQPLAQSPPYTAGPGTHTQNNSTQTITASVAGIPHVHADNSVSITRPSPSHPLLLLPEVASTVLARVTRLNPRQATVEIFAMQPTGGGGGGGGGEGVCEHTFQGVIRAQDVRATEKDRVKMLESFRVGDVVRAVVISLGDQSNYYLSTANNSLGVVVAHSDAGDPLHPINWRQMACARTGIVEERKVAKPI